MDKQHYDNFTLACFDAMADLLRAECKSECYNAERMSLAISDESKAKYLRETFMPNLEHVIRHYQEEYLAREIEPLKSNEL